MRLPDGDRRIGRGIGVGQHRSHRPHGEGRRERRRRSHQHLETRLHLANHLHRLLDAARALLDRDDVRMLAQCHHYVGRNVQSGGLRPVVDHQRDPGLVRDAAVVKQLRFGLDQQALVIMWRAHHRCDVSHIRGPVGQKYGFLNALTARASDQQLARLGISGHQFEHQELLFLGQLDAFARRSAHHVAGESRQIPLRDVVLHLGRIDLTVVVERRRNGWKNAMQLNIFSLQRRPWGIAQAPMWSL